MKNAILSLFEEKECINVCAPMVRYSKLNFRTLVRKYGCDLCFTPMIFADAIIRSPKARAIEFTTNDGDTPLVAQFAANNAEDFVAAAEIVAPDCDGVDLNCGCPQKWALKDGYGADLLNHPHLIEDCVKQLRNRLPEQLTVSVKIRLLNDESQTIALCKNLEAAGVSFITVHARTVDQRCQPINVEALKRIRERVSIPVIANGDVKSLQDAKHLFNLTKCQGMMSARGILHNPGLFAGHTKTEVSVVKDWLAMKHTNFFIFHHHLVFMLEKILTRSERRVFNYLNSASQVIDFISNRFDITPPNPTFFLNLTKASSEFDEGAYFKDKVNEIKEGVDCSVKDDEFLDSINGLYE